MEGVTTTVTEIIGTKKSVQDGGIYALQFLCKMTSYVLRESEREGMTLSQLKRL